MAAMSDRRLEFLFERFRVQGDVDALGAVFDETAPALRRVARHLRRDASEAEDLVQATFLAAIEKRATFDATRELSPWLTGILLVQASVARRARARIIEPDRLEARAVEDPSDAVAARELSEALTRALARLSASDRDVLVPLLLDGRRAVEIARELGRRPDTVHMRIHRGLQRLRRLLPAGFALGALAQLAGTRGLGAVRAEVVRHAGREVRVASAGALTVGVVMSTKKIAVLLALLVVLGIGVGVATSGRDDSRLDSAEIGSSLSMSDVRGVPDSPADERARMAAVGLVESRDASVRTDRLLLQVVREAEGPAAGVLVALLGADGKVTSTRTDADGRCELAPIASVGDLFVRDEAAWPQHFMLEPGPGERTLELARGGELSGRVSMEDGEPASRVELELKADSAPAGLSRATADVFRALDMIENDVPSISARATSSPDGSFRFRTPDERWSGSMRLPDGMEFVDTRPWSMVRSERRFARNATLVELRVRYGQRIVGRLVDANGLVPIGRSRFECTVLDSHGSSGMTGGVSGEDGRFSLPVYGIRASRLQVDLVKLADGRTARVPEIATWSGLVEPIDAGDVECAIVPTYALVVRVTDPEGRAVRRSRLVVRDLDAVVTDEDGVGTITALPLEARELRVAAPGHAIAVVELGDDVASPLDVVLSRTNRLTILLPPEAAARSDLSVQLISRALLFGGTSRMYPQYVRGRMVGRCLSADGDAGTREGKVSLDFAPGGRLELEGIVPGAPFRIRLVGGRDGDPRKGNLGEFAVEPMSAEEQRTFVIPLDDAVSRVLRTLYGRIVDERGRPIHGAYIGVGGAGSGVARSELDGTYRVDFLDADRFDVTVQMRGYVTFESLDRATSDGALDVVLERGRDVRVDVVDTKGSPIEAALLGARVEGVESWWWPRNAPFSTFTLIDIPPGRIELSIVVGGARHTREFDGAVEFARVVLPEHGRLEITRALVPAIDKSSAHRAFRIALRTTGGAGASQTADASEDDSSFTFENVQPGDYEVGLECDANATDDITDYALVGEAKRVTIVGGETGRVDL